jgi:uncharacterized protein
MTFEIGAAAIVRAFESLGPGGRLNLGFFGGEPMLEAERILEWMNWARDESQRSGKPINFNLTTNGTIGSAPAWEIMLAEDVDLAVSFDGNPAIHDRHRRTSRNEPTAAAVERTLRRVLKESKTFTTVIVVRPDNLQEVPDALEYLHAMGVRHANLSLDLWTHWTVQDGKRLDDLVVRLAEKWFRWLPEFSLNWFDTKISELAHLPHTEPTIRCGFGAGEIAVAPSGRLYPCERVVGEDSADNPLRSTAPFSRCTPCSECALNFACDTFCRCSNFIRTGDVNRPDALLCMLNKSTAQATAAVLSRNHLLNPQHPSINPEKMLCLTTIN